MSDGRLYRKGDKDVRILEDEPSVSWAPNLPDRLTSALAVSYKRCQSRTLLAGWKDEEYQVDKETGDV